MFTPSRVDRTINSANRRLGRVTDWPWLKVIGTVAADPSGTFDLGTVEGYRHTILLSYENFDLVPLSPQELVRYGLTSPSSPRVYSIVGDTLTVFPRPQVTTVLNHIYIRDENALAGDSDTPLLPSAYTELLVLAATVTLAMSKQDMGLMQALKSEYKDAISEALDEVNRTRSPLRVQADDSAWGA